MYLQEFRIQRIKCFDDIDIKFAHSKDDFSGWIVLLGGNGMGKSTLLQAMAIALMGPVPGGRLLLNPSGWVRSGADYGEISASIGWGKGDFTLKRPKKNEPYRSRFALSGSKEITLQGTSYDQPQLVHLADDKDRKSLMSGPYAARKPGWLSCGYGPFRRLLGGSSETSQLVFSSGRESRFVTLFSEAAALTNCTEWLCALIVARSTNCKRRPIESASTALEVARKIIDQLLPGSVQISRIDSERVYFRSVGGTEVAVLDLSDGYRSFLALVIDILRHLEASSDSLALVIESDNGKETVIAEGVILIDEVDVHLHPFWQREIGFRLRRTFPRMQFIVTSHSPFVAQAASDGGLIVMRPTGAEGEVEAQRPVDSVKGWRVDQILTSPLFGLTATRDEDTEDLIREHTALVAKRSWGQLAHAERSQLAALETKLAGRLTAPGETVEDASARRRWTNISRRRSKKWERKGDPAPPPEGRSDSRQTYAHLPDQEDDSGESFRPS